MLHQSIANIPMPPKMRALSLTDKGFPVLFFAGIIDGKPDLRVMDGRKLAIAINRKLCWLCGQPLGRNLAFILGPMCAITRTIAEPPNHYDCAAYAVRACPFLARPHMHRRDAGLPEEAAWSETGIKRNPGAAAIWITRSYRPWRAPDGGVLITVGNPERVEWFSEGRHATRAEVEESIESGLPLLFADCERESNPEEARQELRRQIEQAFDLLPESASAAAQG